MGFKKIFCIVMAIFVVILAACSTKPIENDEINPSTEITEEQEGATMGESYSVLFIGNSYTYYNNMPERIFKKIAAASGYQVEVEAITNGAHKLSQFADPTDEYGAIVEEALAGTKTYDFVVLQEQSVLPATEEVTEFYSAVRNLSERIRAAGAEPVLYATWARKVGSVSLDVNGWTNESMTWKLAAAYQAIGDELNIPVAHVGLAFYDVCTNQGDIELYNADKSHPSDMGSYLAATTLFAKMFDVDMYEASYTGNLSTTDANMLCEAARRAVFETPAIPSEYKTISK